MAEKPRELGHFKGWVTLRLNCRLESYVSCQYSYVDHYIRNGYTTTLPLEGFTQRNFVVDFI